MKFRDLEKGTTQGRTEDFPRPGGRVDKVLVMPLLAGRDREIEAGAAAYVEAENKRFPDAPPALAKPGEPTYERGIYAHTILRAVLDPEDHKPYFASVDEILHPEDGLDRDRLALLFELQQQAQADYAPRRGVLTHEQYFDWLNKTAEAGEDTDLPFERSPRSMQRAYHRGTARAYKDLLRDHWSLIQEVDRQRSEISSLRAKSGVGQSSPDEAVTSEKPVGAPITPDSLTPTTRPDEGER